MHSESIEVTPLAETFGASVHAGAGGSLRELDTEEVQSLFRRYGALVFHGFNASVADFVAFSERFCEKFSAYQGGGFRFGGFDRDAVGNDKTVMTTTGGTQGFPIPLHGEYYYGTQVPDILWFHCEQPSPLGGQTTVGDGHELFARLQPETQAYFREHDIRYMRHLDDGTWQKAFMTDDLDEVRRVCDANDTSMRFDEESGTVLTDFACSALRNDRDPDRPAFINNVLPMFYGEKAIESGWVERELGESIRRSPIVVRDENGERLDDALVDDLRRTAEAVTHEIDWAPGNLAMVDNTWVLHGRREAKGEGRSVLVRMGASSFPLT